MFMKDQVVLTQTQTLFISETLGGSCFRFTTVISKLLILSLNTNQKPLQNFRLHTVLQPPKLPLFICCTVNSYSSNQHHSHFDEFF